MKVDGLTHLIIYMLVILAFVKPLGWAIYQVYEGKTTRLNRWWGPIERWIYRITGISPGSEMNWKGYLRAMLLFNLVGLLAVYAINRLQIYFPFNPQSFAGVSEDMSFNTAASYVTNTNWQTYSGENTLSYFTQMMGQTFQNFLSGATGLSLLMAFIRGIVRQSGDSLGNFWVDTLRGTLYIFLPLSLIFSLILVSQGVIQNFKPYQKVEVLQPYHPQDNQHILISEQIIPMGPVASQVAIKQLGSNGGGFFGVNSAHPYENPTPLSNFLEMLAIVLIPGALCFTFGMMVGDRRQGWGLLIAMCLIFIPTASLTIMAEHHPHSAFSALGIAADGNMEGKETRIGITNSALWASATTATSNGSVNSMHDSYTPLGQLGPLLLMHFGEVIFGGVGSGLYGMLMMVIITVFVAGLMVGRTPEYLGKKIEPFEMKMATVAVLVMPLFALLCTAICIVMPSCADTMANPGAHGFTEVLYSWTSMANNNGSSMAGLNSNTLFYNTLGGIVMLFSRYWIAIPVLAIAGSLVKKKKIPTTSGTLVTHTPLFIFLLIIVIVLLGVLSFLPALALGPIVEGLM